MIQNATRTLQSARIARSMELYMHALAPIVYPHMAYPVTFQDYIPDHKQTANYRINLSACSPNAHEVSFDQFFRYWDIITQDLHTAYRYACDVHYFSDDILRMRYLEYLPFSAIADELSSTERTIASWHMRTVQAFLDSYEDKRIDASEGSISIDMIADILMSDPAF
jgi:hypothetical protein